jgi:hypothetical protein
MSSDLGVDDGKYRRADAQRLYDSGHPRTEPLRITGDKTRDAALGEPRIRAGEIIGWRYWKLHNGLLYSVFVPYAWRPGVFERASPKQPGPYNFGYHAFREIEQAQREALLFDYWWPSVVGSVAMWGEVIEHQYGWRSEYAAVRSIIKITGGVRFWIKHSSLQELRKRYGCSVVTNL